MTKEIDYLTVDEPIPGQAWVCLSFLSPEGIMNCSLRGLKIRGVYGTKEEAEKRAKRLQELDPDFDIFVGEMGKWLPWDPEPDTAESQVHQNEQLNELMKGHKENQEKAKVMSEQRKREMLEQAAVEKNNKKSHDSQSVKERLRKKLEEKKKNSGTPTIVPEKAMSKPKIEEVLDEPVVPVCSESCTHTNVEPNMGMSVEDKLSRIQELYNKVHN